MERKGEEKKCRRASFGGETRLRFGQDEETRNRVIVLLQLLLLVTPSLARE